MIQACAGPGHPSRGRFGRRSDSWVTPAPSQGTIQEHPRKEAILRTRTIVLAAALAAAALVALSWIVLSRSRGQIHEAPLEVAVQADPAPIAEKIPAPAATEERAVEPEPQAPPEPEEAVASTLHGTLIVLDAEGEEHAGVDASFELVLWRGGSGKHSPRIQVEKGEWKSNLTPEALEGMELGVARVVAGGREAYVDPEFRFQAPDDLVIEITAKWLGAVHLKVVAEETRADLARVTVVRSKDWRDRTLKHPGSYTDEEVLVEEGTSPIELPWPEANTKSPPRSEPLWVSAPGYAWGRIEIDFTSGGERLLVLERGGALEVALANYQAPGPDEAEALIRVRERPQKEMEDALAALGETDKAALEKLVEDLSKFPDGDIPQVFTRKALMKHFLTGKTTREEGPGEPVAEAAAEGGGPVLIESLKPGRYVLQAEIGERYRDPIILGAAPVEIGAGVKTSVTLELKDRPSAGAKVPLEGTLLFPEEWEHRRISISFSPKDRPQVKPQGKGDAGIQVKLDEMTPVRGKPGLYLWKAGTVVPGKYLATVAAFELQTVIDVGPGGRLDAEIKIGLPASVDVRVVDAETEQPAQVDRILWSCRRPEGITGGGLNSIRRGDEPGVFSFQAPAGEIDVSIHTPGYEPCREKMTAKSSERNALTLKAKRSCGLLVKVREAEQELPYAIIDKAIKVRDEGGNDRVRGWSRDITGRRLILPEPGTYKVTVEKLAGYQPVEPVTVEVPPGQFVEHVVALEREL